MDSTSFVLAIASGNNRTSFNSRIYPMPHCQKTNPLLHEEMLWIMEQIDNVENSVYNNFCFHVVSTRQLTKIRRCTIIAPTVRARKFLFMANSENWTFHLTSSDRLSLIALAIELCYEWMEISALLTDCVDRERLLSRLWQDEGIMIMTGSI